MFSFMPSIPLFWPGFYDWRLQSGFNILLSKHLLQMPHTCGGSDADPDPAIPPFLLPVFGPGVAPTAFAGVAVAVAVAIGVVFSIVVAPTFSAFLRSVIFGLSGGPTHTIRPRVQAR